MFSPFALQFNLFFNDVIRELKKYSVNEKKPIQNDFFSSVFSFQELKREPYTYITGFFFFFTR